MRLEDVLAALPQDQREAVETRFQALQIELAHATGAAIIANDRPIEDALRAEVERLRQLYDNEHTIACRLRTALKTVGDDYPGSSCQQWCYEQAGLTAPSPGASHE